MGKRPSLLITCEHGGRRVPGRCRHLFERRRGVLRTHRAWDAGSLALARLLSRTFGAPLLCTTVTRLVVDVNRSPGHRELFSRYSRTLPEKERGLLLDRYYFPYRQTVQEAVTAASGRPCLHLSIHTFAPVLSGQVRRAAVGLLYDPRRPSEREFCRRFREVLLEAAPGLRVRRNYPYRGTSDGLTTHLRRLFDDGAYLGVELEVNRGVLRTGARRRSLESALVRTLRPLVAPVK